MSQAKRQNAVVRNPETPRAGDSTRSGRNKGLQLRTSVRAGCLGTLAREAAKIAASELAKRL